MNEANLHRLEPLPVDQRTASDVVGPVSPFRGETSVRIEVEVDTLEQSFPLLIGNVQPGRTP